MSFSTGDVVVIVAYSILGLIIVFACLMLLNTWRDEANKKRLDEKLPYLTYWDAMGRVATVIVFGLIIACGVKFLGMKELEQSHSSLQIENCIIGAKSYTDSIYER